MSKPKIPKRISKDRYYLDLAKTVSRRSTCLRVKMGAVVVSVRNKVVGSGYCGAPRKTKDCFQHGFCLRDKMSIPHGQRYELCRSVHAEQNALSSAGERALNGDLFIYAESQDDGALIDVFPCFICKKFIINMEIKRVVCSTKEGGMKIFYVKDWVKEWQKQDIVDDKHQYGK